MGIVVAVLHVLAVPVNKTTSPVDGTLSVRRKTGRPERKHDTGGGLGVVEAAGGSVPGVLAVERTHDIAINGPGESVGLPVNDIFVLIVDRVAVHSEILAVVVWIYG